MLISPVQNTSMKFSGGYAQVRPRITQRFGENPDVYAQFGLSGHNGLDIGPNGDENIFAPMSGTVKIVDSGKTGYGLHIKIRDSKKEVVLAHLSEVYVTDGQFVSIGDKIARMGSTGFSTGRHTHYGLRFLVPGDKPKFDLLVKDYNNGFLGWIDPLPYTIWWKGAGDLLTLI